MFEPLVEIEMSKTNVAVTIDPGPARWLHPVQLGPTTLLNLSTRPAMIANLIDILQRIEPDEHIEFVQRYYKQGLAHFGDAWGYIDQLAVLHAAAAILKPEHYLEIGVFRGRSMAIVANIAPTCAVYGFDLWIENYSGLENPGVEHVRAQLDRVGYRGEATFVPGSSDKTVPAFLREHPDLFFDLITVDGDHTEEGARIDLENVLPRLKVGGVLVFDDISHPAFPWLERAWDDVVGSNRNFVCAKYTEVGHGVAFAIRRDADMYFDEIRGDRDDRLGQLSAQLKEARISGAQLQAMLDVRDQYEASLRETLVAKDVYAASLLDALTTKDTYLESLRESSAAIETYLESLRTVLTGREAEVGQAQEQLAALRAVLEVRETEVRNAASQIDMQEKLLAARETEIRSAKQHIGALEASLAAREAEVAGAEEYIRSLRQALQERETELAHAKRHLASLEQHLEQVNK
jgi:predicted O-methyltransferase YrrM